MKPLGLVGIALVVVGVVVLAMGGFSYTKERDEVQVGPLEVAAERRGFVPPVVGIVAIVAGIGLAIAGRRRS